MAHANKLLWFFMEFCFAFHMRHIGRDKKNLNPLRILILRGFLLMPRLGGPRQRKVVFLEHTNHRSAICLHVKPLHWKLLIHSKLSNLRHWLLLLELKALLRS